MAIIFKQNQYEISDYNFKQVSVLSLSKTFYFSEKKSEQLLSKNLTSHSGEMVLKVSYIFNILNAQRVISVSKDQHFILYFRKLSCTAIKAHLTGRGRLEFPLLKNNEYNQEQLHIKVQSC